MSLNFKESANKVFGKIGSAFKATKTFTVEYSRPILAVALSLVTVLTIGYFGFSVKRFNFFDGETNKTVSIIGGNLEKALLRLDIVDNYEIVSTKNSGNTTDVVIRYTFPVTIKMGNEKFTVDTFTATVKEILGFAGIKMDENDIVNPSADTVIEEKTTVEFFNVEYVQGTYNEVIPHETKIVYSDLLSKGSNQLVSGSDGEQKVYYTQKRINGEVVETIVNNTEIITTAVSGQKIVGTAVPKATAVVTSDAVSTISTLTPTVPIELDANGAPVNYKSKKVVQATAYTYTGHRCSTGVNPQPGYIAVNPAIIPYGTKMYIKSVDGRYIYGYAVAADTGGFIKSRPTNVDLFFSTNSACNAFGRRNVEIYILE